MTLTIVHTSWDNPDMTYGWIWHIPVYATLGNSHYRIFIPLFYSEWLKVIAVLKKFTITCMYHIITSMYFLFFLFFLTKQASPSLLVVLVTFWKMALCYNGIFHFTLKSHMHAIYRFSYIKLNLLNLIIWLL